MFNAYNMDLCQAFFLFSSELAKQYVLDDVLGFCFSSLTSKL